MSLYTEWLIDQISDEDWERIQQHEDAQAEVDDWRKYDHEAAAAYYDELSELEDARADEAFWAHGEW